jgi:hypothetical protein
MAVCHETKSYIGGVLTNLIYFCNIGNKLCADVNRTGA